MSFGDVLLRFRSFVVKAKKKKEGDGDREFKRIILSNKQMKSNYCGLLMMRTLREERKLTRVTPDQTPHL
jgi:hypothetical protein